MHHSSRGGQVLTPRGCGAACGGSLRRHIRLTGRPPHKRVFLMAMRLRSSYFVGSADLEGGASRHSAHGSRSRRLLHRDDWSRGGSMRRWITGSQGQVRRRRRVVVGAFSSIDGVGCGRWRRNDLADCGDIRVCGGTTASENHADFLHVGC